MLFCFFFLEEKKYVIFVLISPLLYSILTERKEEGNSSISIDDGILF